jgi:hypothetical protein
MIALPKQSAFLSEFAAFVPRPRPTNDGYVYVASDVRFWPKADVLSWTAHFFRE